MTAAALPRCSRRETLGLLLGAWAGSVASCGRPATPDVLVAPKPTPEVRIESLVGVLAAPGLGWLVLVEPKTWVEVPWLRAALGRIIQDERLDSLARTTGIDLRAVSELAVASYDADGTILQLVRHGRDPTEIERLFRDRLTGRPYRFVDGAELVHWGGTIGREPHAFVALGHDVVGFQYGGDVDRGPARKAMLFSARKLPQRLSVVQMPSWQVQRTVLGPAPLEVLLPGPFEGELALGARGLFAAASELCATLGPTERQTLALHVLLGGDFSSDTKRARSVLRAAWDDLARSDLGHLLGLHQPASEPAVSVSAAGLGLDVELDAEALLAGLAAATTEGVAEIMR